MTSKRKHFSQIRYGKTNFFSLKVWKYSKRMFVLWIVVVTVRKHTRYCMLEGKLEVKYIMCDEDHKALHLYFHLGFTLTFLFSRHTKGVILSWRKLRGGRLVLFRIEVRGNQFDVLMTQKKNFLCYVTYYHMLVDEKIHKQNVERYR